MSTPQVGVGVVVVRGGRVLLGERRGSHGAGTWALPGGHLEFGEDVAACAARELMEETGLAANGFAQAPYTNDVFSAEGRHYVTLFVVAEGVRGEPRVCEPDKCSGWHWCDWDALPTPLFAPLASLLRSGWRPPGLG
jgi:8-oxo-dGTP diphosphatase